jgi:glycogen operon protein
MTPAVWCLRQRQVKNMLTLLLLAQGVPMLLGGDEMGRTQHGNNNAYCHDNDLSWLDWHKRSEHADLGRFVTQLIRFRKHHAVLRHPRFLTDNPAHRPAIVWHGCQVGQPDWSWESRTLAMHLLGGQTDVDLYLVANAHWEPHVFLLPAPSVPKRWYRLVDTIQAPPADIYAVGEEPLLPSPHRYTVGPRSVVVLVGK